MPKRHLHNFNLRRIVRWRNAYIDEIIMKIFEVFWLNKSEPVSGSGGVTIIEPSRESSKCQTLLTAPPPPYFHAISLIYVIID